VPLVSDLRAGGDSGHPIVVSEPDGEVAEIFGRIAERIAVELAPTRRYRKELKLL
jgi:ATP-binding protein involved in chromosome partitioning